MIKKLLCSLTLAMIGFLSFSTVAFAISNPDDMSWGADNYTWVFENVMQTGDMLFIAEVNIEYTTTPTDYSPDEAFLFEILDATGTLIMESTEIQAWGDRPIAIYLTASDVDAWGLVTDDPYILRVRGNPDIFASGTNNTITETLVAGDYVDQELGLDNEPPSDNELRVRMLWMVTNIEFSDNAAGDYTDWLNGVRYLNADGAEIFLQAWYLFETACPILFLQPTEYISSEPPETTAAYTQELTIDQKWGDTVGNALANIGDFLGVSQAIAGSIVLTVIGISISVFIYQKTQSGISVLLVLALLPFVGAYLGLMPLGLAFAFVIVVIVGMGYFFFSRGAL